MTTAPTPTHEREPPTLATGPVRCTWLPYHRGEAAEPLARPWLARTLAVPEPALGLWRVVHGRPHLDARHAGIDVNWSHSGDLLLVALAQDARVGADIEFLRPRPNAMTLAARFFTPFEAQQLAALPHDTAETRFVRLWCAKEAVLKAHGRGIAFGLERLEFTAEAGPGDFIYVPPYVPHQEINASTDETLECLLVRSDNEAVVVNLDIEPVEKPQGVAWIDPIHKAGD